MTRQQELDRLANLSRPPVAASPAGQLSFIISQVLANPPASDALQDVPENPREHLPNELGASGMGREIVDRALSAPAPTDPTRDMSVPMGVSPHRGFIAPGRLPMGGLRGLGS